MNNVDRCVAHRKQWAQVKTATSMQKLVDLSLDCYCHWAEKYLRQVKFVGFRSLKTRKIECSFTHMRHMVNTYWATPFFVFLALCYVWGMAISKDSLVRLMVQPRGNYSPRRGEIQRLLIIKWPLMCMQFVIFFSFFSEGAALLPPQRAQNREIQFILA